MKTYSIIATVAAAAASLLAFTTPAAAQEIYETPQATASTTTRAAVMAEVIAARGNGPLWVTEAGTVGAPALRQTTTFAAAPAAVPVAAPQAAKPVVATKGLRSMASRGAPAAHAFEGDTGFDNSAASAARVL